MRRWNIRLDGDASVFKELAKSLRTEELRITFDESEHCYFLESSSFDGMEAHLEVYRKSLEIIEELKGPAMLAVGGSGSESIRVANVVEIKEDGSRQVYGYASGHLVMPSIQIDMTISMDNGSTFEISQAAPVPGWLHLLRREDSVRRVFEIYKKPNIDWRDLYVIFEIVQEDIGTNPHKKQWTTEPMESTFKQTANHYRHGKSKFPLPTKPMTIEEGRSFIDGIFLRWLDSKSA
jgi:hypothetical protein